MKLKLLLTAWFLGAAWVQAQVVTYPSLNVSYTAPGSVENTFTTGPVNISISPNHVFNDPNTGTPNPSASRYYGGSISWTGSSSIYGSYARLRFAGAGPEGDNVLLTVGEGQNFWRLRGSGSSADTTLPFSSSSFDFVIKFEDAAWNAMTAKIFLGANANNAVEGTADYQVNVNNAFGTLSTMSWTLFHESWDAAPATLTTTKMFSSDVWTPVSAVPEPSTYAMLLSGMGLLAWLRYRAAQK